jgi:hypothetical protein
MPTTSAAVRKTRSHFTGSCSSAFFRRAAGERRTTW